METSNVQLLKKTEKSHTDSYGLYNYDIMDGAIGTMEIYRFAQEDILTECQFYFPFLSLRDLRNCSS
ncbi:MAG: hypothetical protein MUF58_03940 [Arcicella sp.]|jgi:hypothetical protein|nr:hypothetical protein [Arcicella sp.]